MKFSTRTRYGLRFLIRLANAPRNKLVQLGELARDEGISPGYMEQIVRILRPSGVLRSMRGATGGYALAKSAEEINLEELFVRLEGGISPVRCIAPGGKCERMDKCSTRLFWAAMDEHMRAFLRSVTLQDLIDKYSMHDADCSEGRRAIK